MRIFIGSSYQSAQRGVVELVAGEIEAAGAKAVPWLDPRTVGVDAALWFALLQLSRDVDAAAFIFAEDDTFGARTGRRSFVRGNVLLEFGMFTGALCERSRGA